MAHEWDRWKSAVLSIWNSAAKAFRVQVRGHDGSVYTNAKVSQDGNLHVSIADVDSGLPSGVPVDINEILSVQLSGIQDNATIPVLGEIASGSITASYQILLAAPTGSVNAILAFRNTTDQDVYISMNGSTNHLKLAPGDDPVIPIGAAFMHSDVAIRVKHAGVAPGSGWVSVSAFRRST